MLFSPTKLLNATFCNIFIDCRTWLIMFAFDWQKVVQMKQTYKLITHIPFYSTKTNLGTKTYSQSWCSAIFMSISHFCLLLSQEELVNYSARMLALSKMHFDSPLCNWGLSKMQTVQTKQTSIKPNMTDNACWLKQVGSKG